MARAKSDTDDTGEDLADLNVRVAAEAAAATTADARAGDTAAASADK